ncbi:hypothetical protein Atai01_79700 [Amycolatopsis taiwanensis]|uniref:Uncharacterized protein n=1 Tax=Amycolatopsis taiwanensis TaxID=342230 RepID=A0A9W6R8L1_9PSEU|nr:hypothetical protein Atai01_79700 [Amycolatopsis taiwanensis]
MDAVESQMQALLAQWQAMPATMIAERIGWTSSLTRVQGPGVAVIVRHAGSVQSDRLWARWFGPVRPVVLAGG